MQNTLRNIFTYLSKQLLISLLIFLGVAFVFIKLYEAFLSKKINKKFRFLQDREKEIPFEILLTGGLLLGICLWIKLKYAIPFIWFVCSISMVIGGALGLVPFSFIEKKKQRKL